MSFVERNKLTCVTQVSKTTSCSLLSYIKQTKITYNYSRPSTGNAYDLQGFSIFIRLGSGVATLVHYAIGYISVPSLEGFEEEIYDVIIILLRSLP